MILNESFGCFGLWRLLCQKPSRWYETQRHVYIYRDICSEYSGEHPVSFCLSEIELPQTLVEDIRTRIFAGNWAEYRETSTKWANLAFVPYQVLGVEEQNLETKDEIKPAQSFGERWIGNSITIVTSSAFSYLVDFVFSWFRIQRTKWSIRVFKSVMQIESHWKFVDGCARGSTEENSGSNLGLLFAPVQFQISGERQTLGLSKDLL